MGQGKQRRVDEVVLQRMIEALPSGRWALPNLHEWAAVFGLHHTQGGAAMRRALKLSPVRSDGELSVDNVFGHVVGRVYVYGGKDQTRVYWMRAPAGTTAAEVVASAAKEFKVKVFPSAAPATPRPEPAPAWGASLQPGRVGTSAEVELLFGSAKPTAVSLAKPAVEAVATDAELMRELELRREAVRTAEATLALEQRRLQEVVERLQARVDALQAALQKVAQAG